MSIQNSENILEAKPTPYEIINSMSLPSQPGVFVLGCFERRVTLYHQQTRALNLVYALHRLGYLGNLENKNRKVGSPNSKVKIAVVGAGVAGLTAAAALSRYGNCDVTVLERENKLLPVLDRLEGKEGRYLSPYLYEWPPSSKSDNEVMPEGSPLSWNPGSQKDVVKQLEGEWKKEIKDRDDTVKVILGASSVRLVKGNGSSSGVSLSWYNFDFDNETGAPQEKIKNKKSFKYVILAIGFGFDKVTIGDLETPSYWDSPPYSVDGNEKNKEYLISGTGDGGWTDLFHIALRKAFNQKSFTEDFLDECLTEETIKKLIEIEEEAKLLRAINGDERQFLLEEYNKLEKKGWFDVLRKKVNEIYEKNSKPKLSLQVRTKNYLSLNSFMANRVLGFCLVASEADKPERKGIVELLIGDIVDIKKRQAESKGDKSRYLVILDDGKKECRAMEFDEVLLRHGPGRNNAFEKFDRSLFRENRSALRKVAQIDRTAIRAWPDDYFNEKIYRSREPIESALMIGFATKKSSQTYIDSIQNEFLGLFSDSEILTMESSDCYQVFPLEDTGAKNAGATDVTFVFSGKWGNYMNRVFLPMCINQSYKEPNEFKLVELEKSYLFVPLSARRLREVLKEEEVQEALQEEEVQRDLNKLISIALAKSYGLALNPDPVQFSERMGLGMLIVLWDDNLNSENPETLNCVIKILKDYPASISIRLLILADRTKLNKIYINNIQNALNKESISNSMVRVKFYERAFIQALVQEIMDDPEAGRGHLQMLNERIPEPKQVTPKFIDILGSQIDEFLDKGRIDFWRRFQQELMTRTDSVRRSGNQKISDEEISSVLPKIGYLLTAGTNPESLGHRMKHGSYSSATIDELKQEIGEDCLKAMFNGGLLISNRAGYSFFGDYLSAQEHFYLPVEYFSEYLAGEYLAQEEHRNRNLLRNHLQETNHFQETIWISGRKKYALLFALEIVLEQCSDSKSKLDTLNELLSPLFDRMNEELGAVYFLIEVMEFGLELLPERREHVVSLLLSYDPQGRYLEDIDEYFEHAIKMAKKEERVLAHLRNRAHDNNDPLQVDAASSVWEVTQSNEDKEQIVELSNIPIEIQNANESSRENRINLNKKSEAIRTLLRINKILDEDIKNAIFSLKDRYPYRYEELLEAAIGYSSKEDIQELLDKLLELSGDENVPDRDRQKAAVFLLRFKWMSEQAIESLLNLIEHSGDLFVYKNVFTMLVNKRLGQKQKNQLKKIVREKMDRNNSEEIRLEAIESWKKISPEDKDDGD